MCNAKRIFVCPLDWGLGHATRCIPVIRQLCLEGHQVFIGASGATLILLKSEFPTLEFIDFPGYGITYPRSGRMFLHLLFKTPKILNCILKEHDLLSGLIRKYKFDSVISDNRFGLWNRSVHSIFITHQVMIKCPPGLKFLESLLYRINKWYILHFNECWIPDIEGEKNISGDLSHKYPLPDNARFIGWLSRFNKADDFVTEHKSIDQPECLAIISGPEPQRSIFENILIDTFKNSDFRVCMIRGTPGQKYPLSLPDNIKLMDHASSEIIYTLVKSAKHIICRSGYSTIMDLIALKKNAVLIPTPGQTEQEYLAKYLYEKGLFYYSLQNKFEINNALEECKYDPGLNDSAPSGFNFTLPQNFSIRSSSFTNSPDIV